MQREKKHQRFRTIFCAAIVLFAIVIPFLAVLIAGKCLPAQYDDTFYGELPDMYRRLEQTEGKKIVIIGNSAVPFGVDSALCEELLRQGGEEYAVCNFGLYGALGTRMMLDLAKDRLGEGDIVVFAPEITSQTLSLYFSGLDAWYALDGDTALFWKLPYEDEKILVGNYAGYVSKKYDYYRSGKKAEPSGIYAHASFDARCDLTVAGREYNIMPDGVDENNPIELSASLFDGDFIAYVNSCYADLRAKGVKMFYSFPPMNEASISDADRESVDRFYSFIRESFDFPIMSDIESRIMEKEFFYDSNYHLNESGMIFYTVHLVNDLKNQLGNTTKTNYALPEKPIVPDAGIEGEGDNSDADCFTYRKEGNYYFLDGLTEEGAQRSALTIPYQVNGLYVKGFDAALFAGNETIEEITLQENVAKIANGSFSGCRKLKKIILTHTKPSALSVGYYLLDGTNARVYIGQEYVNAFINDYFWGYYEQKIVSY